jgi:hypothetical protein
VLQATAITGPTTNSADRENRLRPRAELFDGSIADSSSVVQAKARYWVGHHLAPDAVPGIEELFGVKMRNLYVTVTYRYR